MKRLGVLLFPNVELLDVTGPVEMFGYLRDKLSLVFISEKGTPVRSFQSLMIHADVSFQNTPALDFLLIPGGLGARQEVNNSTLIDWLATQATRVEMVMTVCTGAALLAKTDFMAGRRATSNKNAFSWVERQSSQVRWIKEARWVEDRNLFSSSGVAAGIDMSLAVIAKLYGEELAEEIANKTEYVWNKDPSNDPFAT